VSAAPYDELNCGFGVGDAPGAVKENRGRLRLYMGAECLVSSRQVHGSRVVTVTEPLEEDALDGVDGLLTDRPGLGLLIQHADCQAVCLYDPVRRAIANLHCGWRGSVAGILGKAVMEMQSAYGTRPEDLWAAIGPSLGPCCGEFRDWRRFLPRNFGLFRTGRDRFDFWALTRWQLVRAGIPRGQIEVSGICTVCSREYFSYRREGNTGRCATVIVLV